MKIAIVAPSGVPYAVGGAEKFWWGMLAAINKQTTHEVELIKIPSPERNFWEIMESYRRFSELDLNHFDLVISTKYPAWMVGHANHYCYLQHTLRGLYDTYPKDMPKDLLDPPAVLLPLLDLIKATPSRALLPQVFAELEGLRLEANDEGLGLAQFFTLPGPLLRTLVHWFDSIGKHPDNIRRYFAISKNVTSREAYFPQDVPVTVLHHPSDLGSELLEFDGEYQPYLFTASRLDAPKRLDLLIRAFKEVEGDVELRIGGDGPERESLQALAAGDPRIQFLGRITDDELKQQYANALCVPFVPFDEDYGLITLEAMQAGKAVLTVDDSGGVGELLVSGKNGLSVPADADAVAQAMQTLVDHREDTIAMGQFARDSVAHIQWPDIIAEILSGAEEPAASLQDSEVVLSSGTGGPRPKVVVAVSFAVFPPQGGGQNRIFHLYRALAQHADVVLVTLTDYRGPHTDVGLNQEIASGLREHRIAKSPLHQHYDKQNELALGASVGDLVAMRHIDLSSDYLDALRDETANADVVVASHHYMYPAIRQVYQGPLVYESHNVEADMKAAVLGEPALKGGTGELELVEGVDDVELSCASAWLNFNQYVERQCSQDAQLVTACSEDDADRLQSLYQIPKEKMILVPNGVDMSTVTYAPWEERKRYQKRQGLEEARIAVFMGSWHGPNIEAVEAIVDLAAGMQAKSESVWQFWVMGSVCKYLNTALREGRLAELPSNVRLMGMLPEREKAVVLATADVALNPMLTGSGSNLKMMEYAAAGIPIISTPFGNRGLAYCAGVDILEGELEGFERLMNGLSSQASQNLSESAYRVTKGKYRWQSIAEGYRQSLLALLLI